MKMYQVDAFADEVFQGNPAAVLLLERWPADAALQAIAEENNLAETAFATPRADGAWDLRWFTPAHEVDFCGHATVATAHVLATEAGREAPFTFHTRVGPLHVARGPEGYRLDVPNLAPEPLDALPPALDGVFDPAPVRLFRNFENIFADLGSAEAVRAFTPDLARIARLGWIGLAVTGQEAAGARADFVSRYFAPGAGIPEDPVTGSIHATLAPYWSARLGRDRLTAFQASRRGGWLACALAGDRVHLGGGAATYMEAEIRPPAWALSDSVF